MVYICGDRTQMTRIKLISTDFICAKSVRSVQSVFHQKLNNDCKVQVCDATMLKNELLLTT